MGIPSARRLRVDPSEMAVAAPIDHADSAMSGMPENHNGSSGHVEFRYRIADR
jgi:hypothetical protein